MRARSAVIAWSLIAGIAVSACSLVGGEPVTATVLAIDCDRLEAAAQTNAPLAEVVAIGVDQQLEVVLCSNPSTGFSWEDPTWEGAAALELIERKLTEPVDAVPGTPGEEAFRFRATAPGTTIIHFVYSQPWAGGTKGAWLVDLTVTVE